MASVKTYKTSNIAFMPVVEHISRKFALRKETCGYKNYREGRVQTSLGFMGAGVRTKRIDGQLVKCNFFFMRKNGRTSPLSAAETNARASFKLAQAWTKDAMEDLSAITANQQKYRESLQTGKTIKGYYAGNYSSIRGWISAIAITMKNDDETLPQDHMLPAFDA